MSTKEKIENVRQELSEALVGVNAELSKCYNGQEAIDTEEMLQVVIDGLEAMLSELNSETDIRQKAPGLWHIVTDTWPYDNPLRHKIVKAERLYQKL